jgi:hypothetical protein
MLTWARTATKLFHIIKFVHNNESGQPSENASLFFRHFFSEVQAAAVDQHSDPIPEPSWLTTSHANNDKGKPQQYVLTPSHTAPIKQLSPCRACTQMQQSPTLHNQQRRRASRTHHYGGLGPRRYKLATTGFFHVAPICSISA